MEYEHFTLACMRTPAGPPLDEARAAELQDAHLHHIATLHEEGRLLAAGPILDPERRLRGIGVLVGGMEETRELMESDPSVVGGLFELELFEWVTPAGLLRMTDAPVPHSVAEARGG